MSKIWLKKDLGTRVFERERERRRACVRTFELLLKEKACLRCRHEGQTSGGAKRREETVNSFQNRHLDSGLFITMRE